jgi:hypothetical protein
MLIPALDSQGIPNLGPVVNVEQRFKQLVATWCQFASGVSASRLRITQPHAQSRATYRDFSQI